MKESLINIHAATVYSIYTYDYRSDTRWDNSITQFSSSCLLLVVVVVVV